MDEIIRGFNEQVGVEVEVIEALVRQITTTTLNRGTMVFVTNEKYKDSITLLLVQLCDVYDFQFQSRLIGLDSVEFLIWRNKA